MTYSLCCCLRYSHEADTTPKKAASSDEAHEKAYHTHVNSRKPQISEFRHAFTARWERRRSWRKRKNALRIFDWIGCTELRHKKPRRISLAGLHWAYPVDTITRNDRIDIRHAMIPVILYRMLFTCVLRGGIPFPMAGMGPRSQWWYNYCVRCLRFHTRPDSAELAWEVLLYTCFDNTHLSCICQRVCFDDNRIRKFLLIFTKVCVQWCTVSCSGLNHRMLCWSSSDKTPSTQPVSINNTHT